MPQLNKRKPWRMLSLGMALATLPCPRRAFSKVFFYLVVAFCSSSFNVNASFNSKVVVTYKGGTITENEFNQEISMMKFLYPEYEAAASTDIASNAAMPKESILQGFLLFSCGILQFLLQ
jgi:foldase protein PrsA